MIETKAILILTTATDTTIFMLPITHAFYSSEGINSKKRKQTFQLLIRIQYTYNIPPVVAVTVPVSFGQKPSGNLGLSFGAYPPWTSAIIASRAIKLCALCIALRLGAKLARIYPEYSWSFIVFGVVK